MRNKLPVPARVLVADGDVGCRTFVADGLTAEGYEVASVDDGAAALAAIERAKPDLLVVALTLSDMNAPSVCRRLRGQELPVPVIVMAERACGPAHLTSLDAGADDFIAKPIVIEELSARIRAILRRAQADLSPLLVIGDVELDMSRRVVTRTGHRVELTLTEYSILEVLLQNVDVVLEWATIYERVWGFDLHESSKSLDVHIGAIRRKLERHGDRIIENVRGVGYVVWTTQRAVTSADDDLF